MSMYKHIHQMSDFPELFEKLNYESEKFWATYTAIMFDVMKKERLQSFSEFLLLHLRISDNIFIYSKTKVMVILEETTLRGALLLNDMLREKINEKWFKYKYYCSAAQWDFQETYISLEKTLKKRLKKAKEFKTTDCVYSLSYVD